MPDDPRSRRSSRRARPRHSFVCSVRPHRLPLSRRRRTLDTSPVAPFLTIVPAARSRERPSYDCRA
jgi:hypothetical protein